MFDWLRKAFFGTSTVAAYEKKATEQVDTQCPQTPVGAARRNVCAKSSRDFATRVVYARLSPELSRLAAQESIEIQLPRSKAKTHVAQKPAASTLSRRRMVRLRRFSRRFTGMSLSEARLLVAVHRGSLRAIAADNAGQLHRDLQRFLLSTRGQTAFNGKNAPRIEKIRRWVNEARQITRTRVIDPVR